MEFNGTFLATIITFIAFVFLMNKVLYAPILSIMEERRNVINGNYKEAEDNKVRSDGLVEERDAKLAEAKDEAKGKYNEVVDGFKEQRAEIVSKAQETATDELGRSEQELESLSNEVKEGLKCQMNDLANDIVEKVLGYRSEVVGFDDEAVNKILYH